MQQIPVGEPVGDEYSTIHLLIGLSLMVLSLAGIVLYLRWKLPRGADQSREAADPDAEQ